jgi:hypothetical protein
MSPLPHCASQVSAAALIEGLGSEEVSDLLAADYDGDVRNVLEQSSILPGHRACIHLLLTKRPASRLAGETPVAQEVKAH